MNLKSKKSLSEYLIGTGIILAFALGACMFAASVGLNGTVKVVGGIVAYIILMALLVKFSPVLAYCMVILTLVVVGLAVIAGNFEYAATLVFSVLLLGLVVWIIYKIGDRFGWWKQSYPPKY